MMSTRDSSTTLSLPHHDLEGLRKQILANTIILFAKIYQTPEKQQVVATRSDFEIVVEVEDPTTGSGNSNATDIYRALLLCRNWAKSSAKADYNVIARSKLCSSVRGALTGLIDTLARIVRPIKHYEPMKEAQAVSEGEIESHLVWRAHS